MEIANPIYDVVFKYLMEDNKVAKIFISALTGLNIVSLEFLPQELSGDKDDKEEEQEGNKQAKKKAQKEVKKDSGEGAKTPEPPSLSLSVYRLDFAARVKAKDGSERVIIIEIQKSKFASESMRFRSYLGKQYMKRDLFQWILEESGRKYKSGVPILSIYFLGEHIEGFHDVPVMDIRMTISDRHTQAIIEQRNHFIDSLFHQGIIVNIRALSDRRRDELEKLLSIFDQNNRQSNHHIMNVKEMDFPEKFRPIIRRLQAAAQTPEVRDIMNVEDAFLAELADYEHRIAEQTQLAQQERRQKEEAVRKQERERLQKEEAMRKQEEAVRKQEEERLQKEEAVRKQEEERLQKEEAIKLLLSLGIPKEEIAQKLGIPLGDVAALEEE